MIRPSRGAWVAVAAVLACSTAPAVAQAPRRDERQNVRATSATRVCTYQERRLTSAGRRQYSVLVGRGEPCPATVPLQRTAPTAVPAFAQLTGNERRGGKTVCSYVYLGRSYETLTDIGLSCPLTPNIR